MKNTKILKMIPVLIFVTTMIASATATPLLMNNKNLASFDEDIEVTVEIQKIRSLEKFDNHIPAIEKIDLLTDPDFYVKVFINDVEFTSPIWKNTKYVYEPDWSATLNVPDEEEFVDIKIQLWDWNLGIDKLCDISSIYDEGYKDSFDVELMYSIKTGHWFGDDYIDFEQINADPSGYGRLNGCDDGSFYQRERDCELWFDIYQTDSDGDGIPSWTEVNVYNTDPEIDNTGEDFDNDGCPIEWEHKWGHYFWYDWHEDEYHHDWIYDVNSSDNHLELDLDEDGLDNVEEYLTSQWGSDPYRKDLFVELDVMEDNPEGEINIFPEGAKELLRTAYNRRNVVFHLDDGCMGGSDIVPFDDATENEELQSIYWNYFLHGDVNNWKRGVFHYGLMVYFAPPGGHAFWGGVGPYLDSFVISTHYFETEKVIPKTEHKRNIVYASAYMHECGHTLGIFNGNTPGCDDQNSGYPWMKNFWKWRPYKSVMNYGYMYKMVDYSDGSRGKNDFDDWDRIDLESFQREWW